MKPSEYWARQMHATFQEDVVGVSILTEHPNFSDPSSVMWASDYPHADSTWPESQETVRSMFDRVDPEVAQRVLHDNATLLYGLPPFDTEATER